VYGVPYEAVDVPTLFGAVIGEGRFVPSTTQAGAEQMARAIESVARACRGQKIVLAGYSQGAIVVREALNRLQPPDLLTRITGIALFANPRVGAPLSRDVDAITHEECVPGDPVCGIPSRVTIAACLAAAAQVRDGLLGRFAGTCPHFGYPEEDEDAAGFLRSLIQ
jgi:pimeloyl-ACP methyl ester carboxylesterase